LASRKRLTSAEIRTGWLRLSSTERRLPNRRSPHPFSTLATVHARNPNVYIVCASVYPKEEASVEADAFLVKPVSLAALRAALPSR
jgi:hypothetical protein